MGRMHLFEFEDQSWCPHFIREATTDFLFTLYGLMGMYESAFEKIVEVLNKTKFNTIIDCCSGSGGAVQYLREYLDKIDNKSTTITLTDKFPNIKSFRELEASYPNGIIAHEESLDATQLPKKMKGMRTFFSSFHHFRPEMAVKILQNAVNADAPIGIFECTRRHPLEFLTVLFNPIVTLLVLPFSKKLNWSKFLFTYLIPITPFTTMWDYFASNMRTYSPKELNELISNLDAPNYQWEIGKIKSKRGNCIVTYLIGYK